MYLGIYVCETTINVKRVMNLKENKEGNMGGFVREEGKWRNEVIIL